MPSPHRQSAIPLWYYKPIGGGVVLYLTTFVRSAGSGPKGPHRHRCRIAARERKKARLAPDLFPQVSLLRENG